MLAGTGLTTYAASPQGILEQLDDIIVNDTLAVKSLRPSDEKAFG